MNMPISEARVFELLGRSAARESQLTQIANQLASERDTLLARAEAAEAALEDVEQGKECAQGCEECCAATPLELQEPDDDADR